MEQVALTKLGQCVQDVKNEQCVEGEQYPVKIYFNKKNKFLKIFPLKRKFIHNQLSFFVTYWKIK